MSTKFRWAVLLCNCQGTSTNQTAQQFFVNLFTPGLGGAIDYWSDMSFGELDLTNSSVFSWVTLSITTAQALNTRRSDAINMGIDAHKAAGHDLRGFDQILVYIDVPFIGQNITEGGQQGAGSAQGRVLTDQGVMRSDFIMHEMGHGHGLKDESYDIMGNAYGDPYCIMSAMSYGGTDPTFMDPRFGPSGPSLCSPYIFSKNWLPQQNTVLIESNGKWPKTTHLTLSPFERGTTGSPQVAIIRFTHPFTTSYFIDYHQAAGWDRGLSQDAVVIRQYRPDGKSYYAGRIATSVAHVGGVVLLPEGGYLDKQFDLSVDTTRVLADGRVELTIAPAAALQTLSVRTVARNKLGLNSGFSIRGSIMRPGTNSLRWSLVEILGD
ncbi:hypothetical protein AF332_20525 [Sporosarcina globispora]|uniref:Uncharacterized protein n=1 Tax=Sporosarcina globispora TaxID=1459 RepID=A0A0M0GGH3_SPOGL|nr:hypothetical protein [Sporosarcina globispora]KON88939.1 hypothetical protein AF332_20525 [Sporosarcina globispora]